MITIANARAFIAALKRSVVGTARQLVYCRVVARETEGALVESWRSNGPVFYREPIAGTYCEGNERITLHANAPKLWSGLSGKGTLTASDESVTLDANATIAAPSESNAGPEWPELDASEACRMEIPAAAWERALTALATVPKVESRYTLTGPWFRFWSDGRATMFATDGHRAVSAKLPDASGELHSAEYPVPFELIRVCKRVPAARAGDVTVTVAYPWVSVSYQKGAEVVCRIQEGTVPDCVGIWERLEVSTLATVDSAALQAVCTAAAGGTKKGDSCIVRVEFNGALEVAKGGNSWTVEALKRSGPDKVLGINAAYLSDALRSVGDRATIGLTSDSSPILFQHPEHEGIETIVMPCRL